MTVRQAPSWAASIFSLIFTAFKKESFDGLHFTGEEVEVLSGEETLSVS